MPPVPPSPAASTNGHQTRTSFFDLPAELRNKIYHDVLVDDRDIEVHDFAPYVLEPALLRTRKQVRKEALPVFWGANTFAVLYQYKKGLEPSGVEIAQSFLKYLGTEKAVLLGSFRPVNYIDVTVMWNIALSRVAQRKHSSASSCELEYHKAQCQEIVKDLLSIGAALGIREEAILLPMSSGTLRNAWRSTYWVATHEFKDFVQEGSRGDSVFKDLAQIERKVGTCYANLRSEMAVAF